METSDTKRKKTKRIEVQSANAVVLHAGGDVGLLKPAQLVLALDGTYAF